ncbi:MAG: NAD(P)-binding domain-containing protein [Actinomycetota bacterium]|nr:NAD(P)-binding domain-containing protein [Actinomycetota bacterium]
MIGAGISGLTAGKALADRGVPYTCFEASDDIGGNWYFGNPNGRSSAYRSLHIDTSRDCISFRDMPMGAEYPDYPHHSEILEYLNRYADAFGLRESILFETPVERAERLPDGGWSITRAGAEPERFDFLVVANGHHWDPRYPDYPGSFDGETIHSHHYLSPSEPLDFHGKRVLVVGIGNSAVDIVSELSRRGVAERVFLSTRSGAWVIPKYMFGRPSDQVVKTNPRVPLKLQRWLARPLPRLASGRMEDFGLPRPNHEFLEAHPTVSSELMLRLGSGDAIAKPDVAELGGDRVHFRDGSVERIDAIVYATGYRITFPFFDPEFLSAPDNRLPLFKRIFKPGFDDLGFIGLAQTIPTLFPFVELQSKLLARYVGGEYALPPRDQMERVIAADQAKHAGHFKESPRHTMQIEWYSYKHELKRREMPAGRERIEAGTGISFAPHGAAAQEPSLA